MRALLIILFSFFTLGLTAQTSQSSFGKNRVQHRQFEWKYISTKHFNIYYYNGGNKLAHNTARHLESNFESVTHTVGYLPYDRINVLVYNADSDLQQSNISLENSISAGGETKLIKSKIEVSFKGSQVQYYMELDKKLSELFINIIMFGGNFRSKLQSTYLLDFPAWYINGASEYIGYGTTPEMYSAVKDFLKQGQKNPDRLSGRKATLIGQSIYHYLKETYGEYSIANILSLTKATRNEESGIKNSIGVPYEVFIDNWITYYSDRLDMEADEKLEKLKKTSQTAAITQLKLNKSQTKMAYAINKQGIYYVVVYDLETEKKRTLYYGGVKNINWEIDNTIPLIAWRSDTELSLIKYKNGKPYLITKDINKRFNKEKKLFVTFDAILSFDFSSNEKDMVLSGVKNGQSDIYIYNIKTNVAKQITKDLYDDFEPHYSPSGKKIIFSSNRLKDTLRTDYGRYNSISNRYNLFEFSGSKALNRVTDNNKNERQPQYQSENKINFLSSNGISIKLYQTSKDKKIAVNTFKPDNDLLRYYIKGNQIHYHSSKKNRSYIYSEILDTVYSANNYLTHTKIKIEEKRLPDEVLLNRLLGIDPFKTGYDSDTSAWVQVPKESVIKPEGKIKISSPREYTPLYGIDYVISTLVADPIRNVGALLEVGTSDMFGNHRISGTIFAPTNLNSSKISAEYQYLKHNIDFKLKILKDSYLRLNELDVHKQSKTEGVLTASKPFSPVARLEYSTGLSRTSFIDYFALTSLTEHNTYSKNSIQFVYDNTIEKNINQLQGFRMKAGIDSYRKVSGLIDGFNKLFLDIRKYQHLTRDIVFATRLSYGRYGGKQPRVYLLGGVDNWLIQQYNPNPEFDPLAINSLQENPYLLYSDFATNLRGFSYNQMNGNSHFLINAELRIPIAHLLYSGPISSSFFRNLQLNLFYDTGSAWNGLHPFSVDNSINTRSIGQDGEAFSGEVVNYQSPILSAYGFGIRSMIFGYYMKIDLGWGVQNFTTQKPKLQISLGYDF